MTKSTYVAGVIHYTTISTNVTKLAPCVLIQHVVPRVKPSVVVHATEMFSESFNTQSERQTNMSVEKSMPKL